MSEMVERVARAMGVKDKGDDHWDVMSENGDGYGYVGKNEYRAMAHAAIEAMREPTPEMLQNGAAFTPHEHKLEGYNKAKGTAKVSWQAMIDEALK